MTCTCRWWPGGFNLPDDVEWDPECLEHGYQFGAGQCAALVRGTFIATGSIKEPDYWADWRVWGDAAVES